MGIGILGSVSPILSNYRGANKEPEKYFYPSLKFTFLLSIIIFACSFTTGFAQKATRFPANLKVFRHGVNDGKTVNTFKNIKTEFIDKDFEINLISVLNSVLLKKTCFKLNAFSYLP